MSYYPPKMVARPLPTGGGADLYCRKCHQSLTGLRSDQSCPKCGLSVAVSMKGAEIRYSDPAWVKRLYRASLMVFWSSLVLLLALVLAIGNTFDRVMDAHDPTMIAGGACVVFAIGTWFLTAADPSGLGEKSYAKSRKLARIAWAVSAIGTAGLIGAAFGRPTLTTRWEYHLGLEICNVISVAGSVALLVYLSRLADRMRASPISERARMLSKGFAMIGTALIIINLVRDFLLKSQWAIDNDLAGLLLSFQIIGLLTGVVVWIIWILLLRRIGRRLNEQAKLARMTWGGT